MKNRSKKFFIIFLLSLCCIESQAQLNYVFSSTVIPTYSYNPSPTIVFGGNVDEAVSAPVNIGFTFNYQGINYTRLKISSNGWISFDLTNFFALPVNDLSGSTVRPIIAPLWDNVRTSAAGDINYRLGPNPAIPLKNVLTIEWKLMNWNRSTTQEVISFQVKLYDSTNVIEFLYRSENFAPTKATASIGISGSCLNDFYSLNDVSNAPAVLKTVENYNLAGKPQSGQVYRFTPRGVVTPVNDLCANATNLPYNIGFCSVTFGTLVGATNVGSPAPEACWTPVQTDRDVWYVLNKPAGQSTMYITTDNITAICYPFSTEIAVYTGSCGALTLVACASNGGVLNPQSAVLTLSGLPAAATTYYVRVESDGTTQGDFQICVKATNDECGAATVLTPDVTCNYFYSTSVGATNSTTTPIVPIASSLFSAASLDVWFKFTASTNYLIIDTKDLGIIDGAMAIYKGIDCNTLILLPNTFPNPNPYDDDWSNNGDMPRITRNDFAPGGVYFLRVWAKTAPMSGTFGICITERAVCAANAADTCSFAPTIGLGTWCGDNTQSRVTQTGNVTYPPDLLDPGITQFCKVGSGPSFNPSIDNVVYYKFLTSSAGGTVVLDVYNQVCAKDLGLQVALFKPTTACTGPVGWGNAKVCYDSTKDGLNDKKSDPKNFTMTFPSLLPNSFYYIVFDGASADKCTWLMTLSGPITLPIELLSFSGKNSGEYNLLEWVTKSEINNDYFSVERSVDGENFEVIGKVKGGGNSTTSLSYNYTDVAPVTGINYYRLKQVDFNGEVHYSEPIAVEVMSTNLLQLLSVYPNPTEDLINIKLAAQESTRARLIITDVYGKLVIDKEILLNAGITIINERFIDYAKGLYFIRIQVPQKNKQYMAKFVVSGK